MGLIATRLSLADVISWKAFYKDGTEVESKTGSYADCLALPRTGLLTWRLKFEQQWNPGRHYMQDMGNDWYGFVRVGNLSEYYEFELNKPTREPAGVVWIQGALITDEDWAVLRVKADKYR